MARVLWSQPFTGFEGLIMADPFPTAPPCTKNILPPTLPPHTAMLGLLPWPSSPMSTTWLVSQCL